MTPTPTPTLPPAVCHVLILPNFGTPTPTGALTGTPPPDLRRVYHTPEEAATETGAGVFTVPAGFVLGLYQRANQYPAVAFTQIVHEGTLYSGWFNNAYGTQVVSGDCGSLPVPTPTGTPTPDTLADYGIELREDQQSWTASERQAILTGAARIADAFTRFGVLGAAPQARFKTVIGSSLVFLRLAEIQPTNSPYAIYYDTSAGECRVHDPIPSVISTIVVACRGFMRQTNTWITNGEVLETAAVHELGHVLDIRSGNQLRTYVGASFMLPDCSTVGGRIMGVTSGGTWLRGQRGWGTATLVDDAQSISQFQQNPMNSDVETAADMFLNWVYRRTSDVAPTGIPDNFVPNGDVATQLDQLSPACSYPAAGVWQGFRNITKTNSPDDTLPGNRRYWWMEGTLASIFENSRNKWR